MDSVTTKGHSVHQGGLRGHSVGGMYPEMVIGIGDGYAVMNVLTGEQGPVFSTYDGAMFSQIRGSNRADETRYNLLRGIA